jgi:hypothetical protein
MAIAQPLLDVLADSPDFFVARGNTRADILIFALALVLVPPTVLAAVVAAVPAGRARTLVRLVFVAVLAAAFVLQLLKDTGWSSGILIPLASGIGLALGVAYTRVPALRTGLTVLSPVPLVVLVLFLLFSPVSKLILESGDEARAGVGAGPDQPRPVVMVVLDEMASSSLLDRRGDIDATRYPNFAALSRSATWYRNATTAADVTTAAVPALLSGRRLDHDDLPILTDFPRNLFTMLGPGYHFEVEEPMTDLCPERLCGVERRPPLRTRLEQLVDDLSVVSLHLLAPDDLEERLPAVDRAFGGFRDAERGRAPESAADTATETFESPVDEAEQFLNGIDGDDPKGSLYFLHVGIPHIPWRYLPSGRQYAVNGPDLPSLDDEVWEGDRWLVKQAYQRFLLQVGYADRLIGRIVSRMRTEGLWDEAVFVVIADHGVSFHTGRHRRYVSRATFADIAGVPLFVKLPGQRHGSVSEAAVQTTDVLPTILDQLDVKRPGDFDGRTLESVGSRDRIEVFRRVGGEVTVPFPTFLRLQRAAVKRKIAMFGAGDGLRGLYDIGPDRDLIGRAIGELPVRSSSALRGELDGAQLLGSLDEGSRLVPTYLTGRLTGADESRTRLLIAVNGRVTSSTYTFRVQGQTMFAAMVPEASLKPGANDVALMRVEDDGEDRTLSPVAVEGSAPYRLMNRARLQLIMRGGQEVARVRSGAVRGYVERAVRDGGTLHASGWAATPEGPADRIVIFASGRSIGSGRPTDPRDDVAKAVGPAALRSEFTISALLEPGMRLRDLRVIAIRGSQASELARYSGP